MNANFSQDCVNYNSRNISYHEAKLSFEELYQTVYEKLYGVDDVLDEIIGDDL